MLQSIPVALVYLFSPSPLPLHHSFISPIISLFSISSFVLSFFKADNFLKDEVNAHFLNDEETKNKYQHTKKASEVDPKEYAGLLYVGGHGMHFSPILFPLAFLTFYCH